uniref:(northern house mosquito) hypothetical protein n=1 Tax=Culex pipiens TaxID=7175 RepID=A0A8D8C9S1_CULPI
MKSLLNTRGNSKLRCQTRVSSPKPLWRPAGAIWKQPSTQRHRAPSGTWTEFDGTASSTRNVSRFGTRKQRRGTSGCCTTPVGTRSRTNSCEDSKPISSGIRSAAWKSWSARTWNSCIAPTKRASST